MVLADFFLRRHALQDVFPGEGLGAWFVLGLDSAQDLAVKPAGSFQVAAVRQRAVGHPLDLVVEGLLGFFQPAVAGDECRGFMDSTFMMPPFWPAVRRVLRAA
jgi:hypothetical protein